MTNSRRTVESRYIPPGATKVSDKASDAIAYLYTTKKGRPAAVVYYGKQSRSVAHFSYKDDAERAKRVGEQFASRQAFAIAKAEYKAQRSAPNTLTVGDILNTCWGYDQTNREFYEVTEVSGQMVTIREIAQARAETGWATGTCVPQSGEFIGAPMRKRVKYGNSVAIDDHITAFKWNTSEVAGVKIGPALHWSAHA